MNEKERKNKERTNFLSLLNSPVVETGEPISGYSVGVV
jgi:hypothetical protein